MNIYAHFALVAVNAFRKQNRGLTHAGEIQYLLFHLMHLCGDPDQAFSKVSFDEELKNAYLRYNKDIEERKS